MSDLAERRIGTVIGGKWRVDALLGAGSMAAVYAVTHRNGARAALKILHPTLCADQSVCERFLGEGYLTNSVKHNGIVRVLDDGATDDGCVFLVMDLLEGTTLEEARQEREGGRFELPEMLVIADRLMDVLAAVHEVNIIHRDLKPQNVFLCDDGVVKLLDFGVARLAESDTVSQHSSFGLVLGTPSFMSPEQALGARDQIDHRTDIWSLGASIFTGLTGQTVHLGPNIQAKLLAAATAKARSVAMARHDLPAPIANVIDMSLRFKREDRWQSVAAFRHALRETAFELGILERTDLEPESYELPMEEPEALPQDSGERALAMMVRRNAGKSRPPPARGNTNRPPARGTTNRPPPPRPPTNRPAALQHTFIGIGGPESKLSQPPVPSFDEHGPSTERLIALNALNGDNGRQPHLGPANMGMGPRNGSVPPPVHYPAGGMRAPLASLTGIDADGAMDGSFPAASSTLLDELDRRKKSNAGVWVATLLLVAAATAGVAFFAVNRGGGDSGGSNTPTAPSLTSATPPPAATPPPPPASSYMVIGAPDTVVVVTDAGPGVAPTPGKPGKNPTALRQTGKVPGMTTFGKLPTPGTPTASPGKDPADPPGTAVPPTAAPAPTAAPTASSNGLAPDPFATPE